MDAYGGELGQLDVDAGAQARAQVAGTGEDIAEGGAPHVLRPLLLHLVLDLRQIKQQ